MNTALIIALVFESVLLPILAITAFVLGYNVNAEKKILRRKKKSKPTEEEILLKRIDNAKVY